uniref:Uncharacterized protein n=1 Tax=Aegilops tauschii subsp. strangulata TaxID=200361 RepID=A0A453H4S9_AEGTS
MEYLTGSEEESRWRMGSHIYKEKFFPILEISVTSSVSFEGVSSLCKLRSYGWASWTTPCHSE